MGYLTEINAFHCFLGDSKVDGGGQTIFELTEEQKEILMEVASSLDPYTGDISNTWKRLFLDKGACDLSKDERERIVDAWITAFGLVKHGDFEGFFRKVEEFGKDLARKGVNYRDLMMSIHLYEESSTPVLMELYPDKEELRMNLLALDDIYHTAIALLASAYFTVKDEELKRSNELKDLFADIMCHDLLNPVCIIKGMSSILAEEEPICGERGELRTIIKNVDRLEEMLQTASVLAKLESAEKLEFEERDLNEILREVISSFKPFLKEKSIKVEYIGNKRCNAVVNPVIENVFGNLLSNAIKYSPENTQITVGIKGRDKIWKIFVKDQGEGIPDESKEAVFSRFKRMDKRGIKGTGLGLAVVKRVVEMHKGKVWVEDNAGGGSIFYVVIHKNEKEGSD